MFRIENSLREQMLWTQHWNYTPLLSLLASRERERERERENSAETKDGRDFVLKVLWGKASHIE